MSPRLIAIAIVAGLAGTLQAYADHVAFEIGFGSGSWSAYYSSGRCGATVGYEVTTYSPAPVYYSPPPVVVYPAPQPVYYYSPPTVVVQQPAVVVSAPQPRTVFYSAPAPRCRVVCRSW
jgi:hypothetical protein